MQLITVAVASKEAGLEALDRLADAIADGQVTVEDAALVYRNEKGKVKIHQTHDAGAKRGALGGGAVGVLVGLVAAPALIAATAVGAGAGAVLAKARDSGINDDLMKQIGGLIQGDEAAVMVLADDSSATTIGEMVQAAQDRGADIAYDTIPPDAQEFLKEAIKYGTGSV